MIVYAIFMMSILSSVSKWTRTARTKQSIDESPIPRRDHFFLCILLIISSITKYPTPSLMPIIYWFTNLEYPIWSKFNRVP